MRNYVSFVPGNTFKGGSFNLKFSFETWRGTWNARSMTPWILGIESLRRALSHASFSSECSCEPAHASQHCPMTVN